MIIHNLPVRKQLEKLNNSFRALLSKERSGDLNPAFRLQLPLGSIPPRKITQMDLGKQDFASLPIYISP